MEKRYLVEPGEVVSRNDGDQHYITAEQLMDLYGVDPRECIITRKGDRGQREAVGLTLLTPRSDGNYAVEES